MNVQLQPNFRTAERRLPFECVALVLQGGGALGAYQAGVYEALAEANINPDWVAGVSIGAINSAIIAGNETSERVAKLRLLAGNHQQSPARLGYCRPYLRSKRQPPARALQPA
jgi:predicted acylesterase/phospholipase RssA